MGLSKNRISATLILCFFLSLCVSEKLYSDDEIEDMEEEFKQKKFEPTNLERNREGPLIPDYFEELDEVKEVRSRLAMDVNNADYWDELAMIFVREKLWHAAVLHLEKASDLDPNHPVRLNKLGVAYTMANDHKKAMETFEETMEVDEENQRARLLAGTHLMRHGKFDKALEYFEWINTNDPPGLADAHFNIAIIHQQRAGEGRTEEQIESLHSAAEAYRSSLDIDPTRTDALSNLGLIYHMLGDTDSAIDVIEQAVGADVEEAEDDEIEDIFESSKANRKVQMQAAMRNLGSILSDKGEHDRAIALLNTVTSENPDYAEAWYALGMAMLSKISAGGEGIKNLRHSARDAFRMALNKSEQESAKPAYLLGLGRSLFALGELEDAAIALQLSTQVSPENPFEALSYLGDVRSAQRTRLEDVSGSYELLLEELEKRQNARPEIVVSYRHNLGLTYYRMQRFKDAAQQFKKVLSIAEDIPGVDDSSSRQYLIMAELYRGQFDSAVQQAERLNDLYPGSAWAPLALLRLHKGHRFSASENYVLPIQVADLGDNRRQNYVRMVSTIFITGQICSGMDKALWNRIEVEKAFRYATGLAVARQGDTLDSDDAMKRGDQSGPRSRPFSRSRPEVFLLPDEKEQTSARMAALFRTRHTGKGEDRNNVAWIVRSPFAPFQSASRYRTAGFIHNSIDIPDSLLGEIVDPADETRVSKMPALFPDVEYQPQWVLQHYIRDPLLIHGRKWTVMMYVVVTSERPLRFYIYNEGATRFAEEKYSSSKRFEEHLTSELGSSRFRCGERGQSTRTLSQVLKYLARDGVDQTSMRTRIYNVVTEALIAGHAYSRKGLEHLPDRPCVNKILGVEVLFDESKRPWVLQVDAHPKPIWNGVGCNQDPPLEENFAQDWVKLGTEGFEDPRGVTVDGVASESLGKEAAVNAILSAKSKNPKLPELGSEAAALNDVRREYLVSVNRNFVLLHPTQRSQEVYEMVLDPSLVDLAQHNLISAVEEEKKSSKANDEL